MSLSAKLKVMGTVTKESGPQELVKRLAKLIYSTSELLCFAAGSHSPARPPTCGQSANQRKAARTARYGADYS